MLYRKKSVSLQSLSKGGSCLQEKHCDKVLTFKVRQILWGRTSIHASLDVYAIGSCLGISTGVRYVRIPHFLKGVLRYLNVDGHEYISLMPFFIVWTACWRLRAEQEVAPDTNQGRTNETKVSIYSDHGAIQPDQLHDNLLCNVKSILRQGSWQCSNRTKK